MLNKHEAGTILAGTILDSRIKRYADRPMNGWKEKQASIPEERDNFSSGAYCVPSDDQ